MKRYFALVLTLSMLLAICPLGAFAETYSGECGGNVTWSLDTETGVLTISGEGAMEDYDGGNEGLDLPWYKYKDCILYVVIEDGITSIGDCSFYGLSKLALVIIPDSVTRIGYSTFCNCTSLTSVTIGSGVTEIRAYAFEFCYSLSNVSYSGDDWSKIYIAHGNEMLVDAYYYSKCGDKAMWSFDSETYTLTISGTGDMKGYYSEGRPWDGFFWDIRHVVIEDGITSIGDCAFYNCYNLTNIIIPDSVSSIGKYAFAECYNSTSVTIGTGVAIIGDYAFSDCTSLTSITIPNGVTSIGNYAFGGCYESTSVTIPDSVISIGEGAFYGCESLKSVFITDIEAWLNINFDNSTSTPLCNGADLYLNNEKVTDIVIPKGATKINAYIFCGYDKLTSITIPTSIISIGEGAFDGCNTETIINYDGTEWEWSSIAIGDYNYVLTELNIYSGTYGENINWTFNSSTGVLRIYGEGEMANLRYSSEDTPWYDFKDDIIEIVIEDGVTSIGNYAFEYLGNLKNITIPNSVTSIGSCVFSACHSLTSIDIPDSVISIGEGAFRSCGGLTSVSIPDGVISIGDSAFGECYELTSVYIPDSVTYIGDGIFLGCESLTDITIDENNTKYYVFENCIIEKETRTLVAASINGVIPNNGSVTAIGDCVFWGHYEFTSINIPDGITSIGEFAFYSCYNLTSITIPESLTSIGDCAFDNCESIKIVIYGGSEEDWNNISIGDYNDSLTDAYKNSKCEHVWINDFPIEGTCKISKECEKCGAFKQFVNDLAHIAGDEADCENDQVCTVCGIVLTPALGHQNNRFVTPPTCDEEGYTLYVCTVCGEESIGNIVEPNGHSYVADVITPPTCTEKGYTKFTCSVCGDTYTDENVSALGHSYEATVTAPTCASEGYTTFTCSACGDSYIGNIVPVADHFYNSIVTAPTCADKGYTTHTCTVCGDEYIDSYVSALGHTYILKVVKPTCTEQGYNEYNCSDCGDVIKNEFVDALGHTEGEWETLPDGSKELRCEDCGELLDSEEAPEPGYTVGDVDGNGKVNMFDYMKVKSYYFSLATLTEDQFARADITGDGKVNMFDYMRLKAIVFAQ